jgi:GT2 family glycosyltransferase
MIRIISATRLSAAEFSTQSPLGISMARLAFDRRIKACVAFANSAGLPQVFNSGMDLAGEAEILVFMHDDVWIDDYYLADRLIEGLGRADILGLAGSKRRLPGQPSWAFSGFRNGKLAKEMAANMSGLIGHGKEAFGKVSRYGPAPADCELLDGVFLAARKSTLSRHGIRFDTRFDFHFYDVDFCRQARSKGLRLSTWPICMTHQSGGAFSTASWKDGYDRYLAKWPD